MKSLNISAEQLNLVIVGTENAIGDLQKTPEHYGYGSVMAVDEAQMSARLLTLEYPPCNTINFSKDGKATENFEALLIGFGQVGQEVLKSIVMNGQFEGSHFKLAVFATDCEHTNGQFTNQLKSLRDEYDITFYNHDARSCEMYEYLNSHSNTLKYVAICTGSEKTNREIAENLVSYFKHIGCQIPIYKCSRAGIDAYTSDGTIASSHSIYQSRVLCSNHLDKMAMIVNHRYQPESARTPMQNWMDCDYFSRQSCRAYADFVPAIIRASGKTTQQILNGDWTLTDDQIENLSITEHLRWCAFHYCMGFSAMTEEEFNERTALYKQQTEKSGKATVRISKNMTGHTHACLIPWNELDDLSKKESGITGKCVNYKAADTENINAIPQLLQSV